MAKSNETETITDAQILSRPEIEKLMLNTGMNKYDLILLVRRWAYELKSKDNEDKSIQEIITASIDDILGNRVSMKTVADLPAFVHKRQKSIFDQIPKDEVMPLPADEPEEKSSSKKKSKSSKDSAKD